MEQTISKHDDVIDSRDVIARIEELEGYWEEYGELDIIDALELSELWELAEEGESLPDWPYGETLIHDKYFTEYAEQLAYDIGAVSPNNAWPVSEINWNAAAEALLQDYMQISWGDETFWIRA
jgi:hypothetical protein